MDDMHELKKSWRTVVVSLFGLVPREALWEFDSVLSEKAAAALPLVPGAVLLGFSPMSDEPDLTGFYRAWQAGGGVLALPVWLGGDRMLLRRVDDLDSQLRAGRGGIMEPLEELPEVVPDDLHAVIVPGRAFSEFLDRLGRGSGCYDTLLRERGCRRIGVAYDFQVFPRIPTEERDVRLDVLLTPGRTIERRSGA